MIERTVAEQQRALYWHRKRQDRETPRQWLRESDELLYWVEECVVQELRIVPGWVMPRLTQLLHQADPSLPRAMGRERRPQHVIDYLFQAQELLMEQAVQMRQPATIIPLFR